MKLLTAKHFLATALIALSATSLSGAARAGTDSGLYAAAPPPNSVFIRMVAAPGDGHAVAGTIGAAKYSVAAGTASAYKVIPSGQTVLKVGAVAKPLTLMDGHFYTLVVGGSQAQPAFNLIDDPKLDSKVKGLITFYNLTGRPNLSLKTADGKAVVVATTPSGRVGSRSVNSATTGFAVFDGAAAVGTVAPQTIERGNAYSSIALEAGGRLKVLWVRSVTGR
ncbi:MAG: alginate O-acetyltransferase AlgF [Asticcacaulis sp.]|uniref:alginate O-acetyltransferase AlgF n=1 Tax=Asticcacaulis sp. TaxID=1872648 RepID=UPI0039E25889